jgi:hypothetical protein
MSRASGFYFPLDPKTHLLTAKPAPYGLAALTGGIASFIFSLSSALLPFS